MGNTASAPNSSTQESHTESNITTLPYFIDEIAMHYMLTQNSIELIRISDKEYYDNLIILTSNVIEKRLNNLEIGYLKNRITGNTDQIQDILPANSKVKDKVVMDISKFYIKIVMIYSAIASTFDPQYSYSDESGVKSFYLKDFEEYKNIPKNVKPELIQLTNPLSLCRKRLNILKNRYDDTSEPGSVILNPGEKLCSTESSVKLTDEIGIKELDSLYYDLFDYNTKTWSKRSNKMKKKYNKDLILFYRIFTGKKNKPSNVKSFQDIELLDFKTLNSCSENTFLSDIVISKENKLVKQYKEKIDLIQSSTEDNRNQLYSILKELFIIKVVDNEQSYTINPSLTLDKILLLEEKTRNVILDLYISCEKYFIQALIIFENIYESKDYTVSELRKENLMQIQENTTPNYKDTLIIPPFSPDMSLSPEPFNPQTPNPASQNYLGPQPMFEYATQYQPPPQQTFPETPQMTPEPPQQTFPETPQINPETPQQTFPETPQINPETPQQIFPETPQMTPEPQQMTPEPPQQPFPETPQMTPEPQQMTSEPPQMTSEPPQQTFQEPPQQTFQEPPQQTFQEPSPQINPETPQMTPEPLPEQPESQPLPDSQDVSEPLTQPQSISNIKSQNQTNMKEVPETLQNSQPKNELFPINKSSSNTKFNLQSQVKSDPVNPSNTLSINSKNKQSFPARSNTLKNLTPEYPPELKFNKK